MDKDNTKKVVRARGFVVQRSYFYDVSAEKVADNGETVRYVPDDAISQDDWRKMIVDEWTSYFSKNVLEGAFIFHDRDVQPDTGDPVLIHVHGVIRYKDAKTQTAVMKHLGLTSLKNCQPVESYSAAYRYLIHVSDSALNGQKTIYNENELYVFNLDFKKAMVNASDRKHKKADRAKIDDFVSGLHLAVLRDGMTPDEARDVIFSEFGEDPNAIRAYVRERSVFARDALEYDRYRANQRKENGRSLLNTYIFGYGGIGKTVLARAMARLKQDSRGYHTVSQDSGKTTFDFLSLYRGERVSILDEITPTTFPFRQFNGVFDQDNYTGVSSRNDDKDWLADYAIFTQTMSFDMFRYNMIRHSDEGSENIGKRGEVYVSSYVENNFWQISRRFGVVIYMHKLKNDLVAVRVYRLNRRHRGFSFLGDLYAETSFPAGRSTTPAQYGSIMAHTCPESLAAAVWDLIDSASSETLPVVPDKYVYIRPDVYLDESAPPIGVDSDLFDPDASDDLSDVCVSDFASSVDDVNMLDINGLTLDNCSDIF